MFLIRVFYGQEKGKFQNSPHVPDQPLLRSNMKKIFGEVFILSSPKWRKTHLSIWRKGEIFGCPNYCRLGGDVSDVERWDKYSYQKDSPKPSCKVCLRGLDFVKRYNNFRKQQGLRSFK